MEKDCGDRLVYTEEFCQKLEALAKSHGLLRELPHIEMFTAGIGDILEVGEGKRPPMVSLTKDGQNIYIFLGVICDITRQIGQDKDKFSSSDMIPGLMAGVIADLIFRDNHPRICSFLDRGRFGKYVLGKMLSLQKSRYVHRHHFTYRALFDQ